MAETQTQNDLRHALDDLLRDVEADAPHALRVFRAWCVERRVDIEHLAITGDWPDS